ncbi:sodium transporter, partial [candidate division GN15 bacterium]|nr:sodium transporter [candidate division GN15 bacterium]
IGLQWFYQMNSDGTGYLAQRSMGCRTDRDARVAGVLFAWLQILLRSLFWLVIGVGILVLYPFGLEEVGSESFAAAREILFVTGINEHLPPGVRGLMLTGLLAALASTIDTHLNWGASYWSNDIYKRLICERWLRRHPKNIELVAAARFSNLLILVIAVTIMANLGSIQTAWFISLLFGAGMGAVLVLRWLWERINLYSELAAIITSLVVAPILLVVTEQEWIRLGGMALTSTVMAVLITYVTPPTDDQTRVAFYKRVQPPGLWKQTARLAGAEPSRPGDRLINRLILTGSCGLSLFFLLYGIGRLLVRLPDQPFWWPLGAIALGLALIPIWYRRAFGD